MLGAIAGDIIGSVYEGAPIETTEFPLFSPGSRFTDDTVLTVAVADCLLHGRDFAAAFHEYHEAYPRAGYGGTFSYWARTRCPNPYNSWGNGSAMRVSPVGWAFDSLEEVLAWARRSAEVTHDHPEGVKGAQATAVAVFLARTGRSQRQLREEIEERFRYDLGEPLDAIRPRYGFDVSCQGSVPQSIRAFLEAADYESAVRGAVSLGGDADTMAAIAGGIAHAYFGGVPEDIRSQAFARLDSRLRAVVEAFHERFEVP